MRLPNEVRAAKCSERWIGLRSPVSCAKPTTSEDDTVFSSVSVMPTDKSSKNSVRSGGRFMRQIHPDSLLAGALLLGRGHRAWPRRTAWIVPIGHALFEEGVTRRALLGRIVPGLTGTAELVVGPEHTAPFVGSGRIAVLATPVMINLIEAAALAAIEHLLPAGHQGLGIQLDISHTAATPMGLRVTAT